jgi:hypothetical protein
MDALQPQIMLEKVKKMQPPKSPTETINFKDLGPSGKVQVGKQAGLDLTADAAVETLDESLAPPPQPRKLKR